MHKYNPNKCSVCFYIAISSNGLWTFFYLRRNDEVFKLQYFHLYSNSYCKFQYLFLVCALKLFFNLRCSIYQFVFNLRILGFMYRKMFKVKRKPARLQCRTCWSTRCSLSRNAPRNWDSKAKKRPRRWM